MNGEKYTYLRDLWKRDLMYFIVQSRRKRKKPSKFLVCATEWMRAPLRKEYTEEDPQFWEKNTMKSISEQDEFEMPSRSSVENVGSCINGMQLRWKSVVRHLRLEISIYSVPYFKKNVFYLSNLGPGHHQHRMIVMEADKVAERTMWDEMNKGHRHSQIPYLVSWRGWGGHVSRCRSRSHRRQQENKKKSKRVLVPWQLSRRNTF